MPRFLKSVNHSYKSFAVRMKKIFLIFIQVPILIITADAQLLKAKIKVDIDRQIGEVDQLLYGNFTEHLGRCIYGGIYDPKSAKADANGFRNDVIEAARNLGVSSIRWPGGNFASGYHWMDG